LPDRAVIICLIPIAVALERLVELFESHWIGYEILERAQRLIVNVGDRLNARLEPGFEIFLGRPDLSSHICVLLGRSGQAGIDRRQIRLDLCTQTQRFESKTIAL
jgi:hypothetical protein